ncbi:MAG: CoA transferase [Myxococcota bacterium]|nr:CoA transferase [Myxococcota bacterium]
MTERLLHGIRVVDLAGEPAAMAGRILADLGAEVVKVEPPGGDPLRRVGPFAGAGTEGERSLRFAAWNAGKIGLVCQADDPRLDHLLAGSDIVIQTPGWPGVLEVDPARARHTVWLRVTPFGDDGPRSAWRASDLGVMAASGNMFSTGFPDRAPVRCSEPSGYGHVGPEVAFAALTAHATGRPQIVDVSMQEVVILSNMSSVASYPKTGDRGARRGASIGRTREVWKCKNGFVTFGLRGGPARVPSLKIITRLLVENGIEAPAWTERDWAKFNPNDTSDEEMAALEEPLVELFARYEMGALFEIACESNLMLASVNTPREVYASAQLAEREMFASLDGLAGFPTRFALVTSTDDEAAPIDARRGAPPLEPDATHTSAPLALPHPLALPLPLPLALPLPLPDWEARTAPSRATSGGAWQGMKLVEFGSGAAGPIAARYFAEQGATVVKVESRARPDFLRIYALGPGNPHGLEGSPLFNALNVGKRSITLNLKDAKGLEIARKLMYWSDAVLENFAPKAMRGFGLDYDRVAADKPDLVMVSSCMNGQTGPDRNYPGFGAQGSALACFNHLTGWADREPVGPFATITDSMSPRFSATAIAAGVLYRRRTGRGVHIDVSQVENALFTLSPWLMDYAVNGNITGRIGNRSLRAAPHGAFPCLPEAEIDDRWVAIAVWSDEEWAKLASIIGLTDPALATTQARLARVDEVEAALAAWTRERTRAAVADTLQSAGIEAVPVSDFGDLDADPQLAHRAHFLHLEHTVIGSSLYERNGFRLSDAPSTYPHATPALGQHTENVLRELLELPAAEVTALQEAGALD